MLLYRPTLSFWLLGSQTVPLLHRAPALSSLIMHMKFAQVVLPAVAQTFSLTFCFAGSVSVFDVRAGSGAGSSALQLRVACERIGAAAFVNVGGGSDAVIAASDDGCVTMFDSRRTDLPLSIVEVSHGAAAVQSVLCVLS